MFVHRELGGGNYKPTPRPLSPMIGASKPTASPFHTPMSQASTAVFAPGELSNLSMLPDTCHSPSGLQRTWSDSTHASSLKFLRTSSGDSWLPDEALKEDTSEDLDEDVAGLEGRALCVGLPPLESELARWARAQVLSEELLQDDTAPEELVEFLVDRSDFETDTVGLAYRRSMNPWDRELRIAGPGWGSTIKGVVVEDGWVKVGQLYLPMSIAGFQVLTRLEQPMSQALRDGPALTAEGVVLELEGGSRIHFSHGRGQAASSEAKEAAKVAHRNLRAAEIAHGACTAEAAIEAEEVAALDLGGVLHGALLGDADDGHPLAPRLKLLRQKRRARGSRPSFADERLDPLCIGPNGQAFVLLQEGPSQTQRVRRQLKRRWLRHKATQPLLGDGTAWVMDVNGVLHC